MALRKVTKLLVVHVTATRPSLDIGAAEVRAMHLALGWSDIGYNEIIRRDGQLENGRGVGAVGAHVAGFNSIAYGISLVGGLDAYGRPEHNATAAQMETLQRRLGEVGALYPGAGVCGHRDLSPDRNGNGVIEAAEHIKACPCFDAIPWAASVGLPAADIKGNWGEVFTVPAANDASETKVAGPDARLIYLQKLLARAGLQFGPIDGIVGDKTAAALRLYQGWHDLPQSGAFDPATVKALRAAFEKGAA